jgi:hypothetical protein
VSHFTVGVIVRRPEDLESVLAKYNEQDEDYMVREISWTREEYIRDYRTRNPETDLTDEAIWDFAREDYGPDCCDEENIYSFYNPDARWDWWVLGGRWRYQLKVRKNTPHLKDRDFFAEEPRKQRGRYRWCDAAPIKDILWSHLNRAEPERIKQMSRFWDVVVDGAEKREDEDFGFHWKGEYYREIYRTKENYIMKENTFYTHDLLDGIDDEWYTMGDMGWFGCDNSTSESFEQYLRDFYEIIQRPEYQDYWFCVVDCHI